MMSKIALLFAFLLFSLILGNSYALSFDELNSFDDSKIRLFLIQILWTLIQIFLLKIILKGI